MLEYPMRESFALTSALAAEAVTAFETEKAEHTDAVGKLGEEIRGLSETLKPYGFLWILCDNK